MRRIAGAVLIVAGSICTTGAAVSQSVHSEWLYGPGLLFFAMGLFQISRQRDDDAKNE